MVCDDISGTPEQSNLKTSVFGLVHTTKLIRFDYPLDKVGGLSSIVRGKSVVETQYKNGVRGLEGIRENADTGSC